MKTLILCCLFGLGLALNIPSFDQSWFEIEVDERLPTFLDDDPPPWVQAAKMARYIVHHSG